MILLNGSWGVGLPKPPKPPKPTSSSAEYWLRRGKELIDKYGGVSEICMYGSPYEIRDFIRYLKVSKLEVIKRGGTPNPVTDKYIEKLQRCLKGDRSFEITKIAPAKPKEVKEVKISLPKITFIPEKKVSVFGFEMDWKTLVLIILLTLLFIEAIK